MHDYNLTQDLAIHTRFDYLDLISRSHICQNYNQQTVFCFLSTVVQWCIVATHQKDQAQYALCDWCVSNPFHTK